MECTSCGAIQEIGVQQCPACGTASKSIEGLSENLEMADITTTAPRSAQNLPNSKLIEFPGIARSSFPQWRLELSERVREVQERRAREAALEAAEQEPQNAEQEPQNKDGDAAVQPLLELLPQAEVAPLNPLVKAALRRIERAHHQVAQEPNRHVSAAGRVALAYAPDSEFCSETLAEHEIVRADAVAVFESQPFDNPSDLEPPEPEKIHNLVVVPPQVTTEKQTPPPKPRRLIVENDPALNYLDSVPTYICVDVVKYHRASVFARALGALVDLMVVALLCAPFGALVELTRGNWKDLRVAITAAALFSVMSFLYFTISTALTGRTVGMRLFSLRIVDARTGLIPTGRQSAGRALVYLGTILTLGLASLYVLIDRDKQTAHDRLARTTVIPL